MQKMFGGLQVVLSIHMAEIKTGYHYLCGITGDIPPSILKSNGILLRKSCALQIVACATFKFAFCT